MQKIFNVVAVGRAYTDVIAHASAEFLQAHQIPIDGQRECSVAELKKIQALLSTTQMVAGGPGANTAAIVSALGGRAGYFGKVYRDAAGEGFLADFSQRKVAMCCSAYATAPELSGTCLVLLTDASRSFAYNPGCSDYFSTADFAKFDFLTTDFFLLEAHLLTSEIARPAIMKAVEQAKNKAIIVVNLHGIVDWQAFHDVAQYISSQADIIIGNQNEQNAFALAVDCSPLSQFIVTTKGADGAELWQFGHVLCHVPAEKPKSFVSSIGAGDGFIAGFLLGQSSGMNLEKSMRYAVRTAAAILGESGARPTHPLAQLFLE